MIRQRTYAVVAGISIVCSLLRRRTCSRHPMNFCTPRRWTYAQQPFEPIVLML